MSHPSALLLEECDSQFFHMSYFYKLVELIDANTVEDTSCFLVAKETFLTNQTIWMPYPQKKHTLKKMQYVRINKSSITANWW